MTVYKLPPEMMNTSLHEIQADLQRLANQQNQMQHQQHQMPPGGGGGHVPAGPLQSFATLHQQQLNYNNQQSLSYNNQHLNYIEYSNGGGSGDSRFNNVGHHQPHQMHSLMAPQQPPGSRGQDGGGYSMVIGGGIPQHQQWHSLDQNNYAYTTNAAPPPPPRGYNQGFSLHGGVGSNNYQDSGYMDSHGGGGGGGEFYLHEPPPPPPPQGVPVTPSRRSWGQYQSTPPIPVQQPPQQHTTWATATRREGIASLSSSPKGHGMLHNGGGPMTELPPPTPPPRQSVSHAPLPTPPVDDMEPQSISFIGTGDDELNSGLRKLNITSGSRTYRIPSPTRNHPRNSVVSSSSPITHTNIGQQQQQLQHKKAEQGFYVSLDDEQPKRPKPPLRTKRMSPKKERGLTQVIEGSTLTAAEVVNRGGGGSVVMVESSAYRCQEERVPPTHHHHQHNHSQDNISSRSQSSSSSNISSGGQLSPPPPKDQHGIGIIIGSQPDPNMMDEMERKKERILMLSLARRQAQEEARNMKEMEAARRRDQEKQREEDRLRKKEERERRRAAILDRYKMKKAVEEAEREGKQVDKELLASLKAGLGVGASGGGSSGPMLGGSGGTTPGGGGGGAPTRMRNRGSQGYTPKPRPKTIHIEPGQDVHDSSSMTPSRGKKGSSSNLSVFGTPMRRDYYRGSQDCLTETRKPSPRSLYAEIGDQSRGTSPGRSLARRSSYKTSRDASPDVRTFGRHKYGTYQAHRKSNSLMNLTGSSCEQESIYRYGETDSGLGRATPRAPSPSGPGSLPVRRRFDDSVSDTGSDYSGPRLYRQPTTKSNKGIVLNAVEYCVFPGAVNREAKRRVLEEINRSEAKHFLVLFRDAGCQFRALYSYQPDTEEVTKLYGTGPKQVTDRMFDKFFKYNSGGKCFSQVHTKHLTVTIDAFTIHNSLWQGKKVNLPNKRDMTLVI